MFDDRSFTFVTKTPPTPNLLRARRRRAQGREERPVSKRSAASRKAQLEEIARTKMPDLNTTDLEAAKLQVAGTARSMGITIDD